MLGAKVDAQSPSSVRLSTPEEMSVVPVDLQLKMGGKPDQCMSAKMDYSAGQWGQYLLEGASS